MYTVNIQYYVFYNKNNHEYHYNYLIFILVIVALSKFFEVGDGGYRMDVIKRILLQLPTIIEWLENQEILSFYGISLIILYEGQSPVSSKEYSDTKVDLRLVDFEQCYERNQADYMHDAARVLENVKAIKRLLINLQKKIEKLYS